MIFAHFLQRFLSFFFCKYTTFPFFALRSILYLIVQLPFQSFQYGGKRKLQNAVHLYIQSLANMQKKKKNEYTSHNPRGLTSKENQSNNSKQKKKIQKARRGGIQNLKTLGGFSFLFVRTNLCVNRSQPRI